MRNLSSSRTSSRTRSVPVRGAFTLIELLIVITIISLLIALIAPALAGVFHKAKVAQVQVELMGLDAAANDFKGASAGNVHPPSFIRLYEKPSGWAGDSSSRRAIRRIFGDEFNFSIPHDINGNGNSNDVITLNGAECLVFFLGGIPRPSGNTWQVHGFSKSKSNPFRYTGSEKNRRQFFTEWDVGRFSDIDGDGMPEYSDIFNIGEGRPYLYVSTTRTGSYQANDLKPSGMRSVYHQGTTNTPWKKSGFQIISPGADHTYGRGGKYTLDGGVFGRNVEKDNITNFGQGALDE